MILKKEHILKSVARRFAVIYEDEKLRLIEFYELLAGQDFVTIHRVYMLGGDLYFEEQGIELEEITESLIKKAISLVGGSIIQQDLRELSALVKKLGEVPLEDVDKFDQIERIAAGKFKKISEKYFIKKRPLNFFRKK